MLVYGINHHTTPLAIREKLAFSETQLPSALQNLMAYEGVNEAVILSTCSRTEIYTNVVDTKIIQQWLLQQKLLSADQLDKYRYVHHGTEAVRHMIRVASGLDSTLLGEPQVLGQMKQAYHIALQAGTIGTHFNRLFSAIFEASKQIRTETNIGAHPISIAYAITQLAKKMYGQLMECRILLIGSGETIALIATQLHSMGVKKIVIANRTPEKIQALVNMLQADAIRTQDIPVYLKESDIVICATASSLPIIGKGMVESALKHRERKHFLLIDLAVPRDIEPEVSALRRVALYNIDDIQKIIAKNLKNRRAAAAQAEALVNLQTTNFFRDMRVFNARHVIAEYRDRLNKIRQCEQAKAIKQLQLGYDAKTVLEQFGETLMNKIMHHPTMKLRAAASEEQCEMFTQIKTFFELA